MSEFINTEEKYGAHHYAPLPVVLTRGEGVYVWDEHGKKYFDFMSAYSAVSHGHCHPGLVEVLTNQAKQLAMVSRAYYTDKLGAFLKRICEVTGLDMALPMNTGAEAVETAIKAARKWAYTVKGVAKDKAEIIVCNGNFHGRTLAIISMSSTDQYKENFGPLTPGFNLIPFNDVAALEQAITPNTAAFMVEPIQGEGGIIMPSPGYLKACQDICRKNNVLLICDEIQTGMGRTGKLFASQHDDVTPDGLILGKALGGGLLPVSMFVSTKEVMEVFVPGDHGSTFGGNPLASVVGLEAVNLLVDGGLVENSAVLGEYLINELNKINTPLVTQVRGKGLFVGLEINPDITTARDVCMQLMERGILSKETHDTVVRLAPPLVITKVQIDEILAIIREVLQEISKSHSLEYSDELVG